MKAREFALCALFWVVLFGAFLVASAIQYS